MTIEDERHFEEIVNRALFLLIDSITNRRVSPGQARESAYQRILSAVERYERSLKG